jgi:hypothetical protein
MTRHVAALVGMVWLVSTFLQGVGGSAEPPPTVPAEDYALYDDIVKKKFLTSGTRLVVLERMTAARLIPDHEGALTLAWFQAQRYFNGELPMDLVRDFITLNQDQTRLEGRFQFGVRYRFVSGSTLEEPEVRAAFPVGARPGIPLQASPVIDRLAFSRVGRTLPNDQALVFAEQTRADGTGAGFLLWFTRHGREWMIYDTEVVWTVGRPEFEDSPLLAP